MQDPVNSQNRQIPAVASPAKPRRQPGPPRRNKLFHKNRWLISVNVVAALRRAGVECDIVIPALAGYDPALPKH